MGCNCRRGGGRTGVPVKRQPTKAVELEALDPAKLPKMPSKDHTLLRYVGKSSTDLFFKGRTGKSYIFSANRRFAWVDKLDVGRLSQKSVLKIVKVESTNESIDVQPG